MTNEQIFDKFRMTKKHLVDITGIKNWRCRNTPIDLKEYELRGITEEVINTFCACPFCGASLYNNEQEENYKQYVVYHRGGHFYGEVIPDEWYHNSYDRFDDAVRNMTDLVKCCGFDENDVYLEDRDYDVTARYVDGEFEWS